MQRMDLCGRCVEAMRQKHLVRLVNRPINYKITCECCQLRRYGGTYDVEPKKERGKNV